LAFGPSEATRTTARVVADMIDARASILTRRRRTVINVCTNQNARNASNRNVNQSA